MVVKELTVNDLSHLDYNLRQNLEITPDQVDYRASTAKRAHQFNYSEGSWSPAEYEGFAIVSMVDNNPGNSSLSAQLQIVQQQLMATLDSTAFYLLPSQSFHQTVANTLSDNRFKENITDKGKENIYPALIANAVRNIPMPHGNNPIRMRLSGLSIFGTAIGILGLINEEEDYKKITSFRSQFYRDEALNELDVKMTRPFIGHITLAYIERELSLQEKAELAATVNAINLGLIGSALEFVISRAELRRYHNLAEFIQEEHYPVFHFTN